MIVKQLPQPGDIVATRTIDQGVTVDTLGIVLVARRDEPRPSEATDLSNVVPFARPRRPGAPDAIPLPAITADERPAPQSLGSGIGRMIALLGASLALHSTPLAMLWISPPPKASIGVEVISVEITLGANTAAGLAPTPGEQESQPVSGSEQPEQEKPVTEQSQAATVMPQEVPVAPQEAAPEVTQQEAVPETQAVEPTPPEQRPETATAESPASTQPTDKPPQQTEQPRPQIRTEQKAPERKRIAAPTDKMTAQKKQAAATAATAASGVGRGRSDNSANYNGMVAAHLARHKQYPASARSAGAQGVATVAFSIDGNGRVTSARLAGGSGNPAIDQEVVAMARRASPFPPPPDGKGRNFTVPVRFNLR
jgi:periplasmic protein TonB